MCNNRVILYARCFGDTRKRLIKTLHPDVNGVMDVRFSTTSVPNELDLAGQGMTMQYKNLRECANFRNLEIVDEVIVCEPNDTMARAGWREAVRLALEKDADTIAVINSSCVSRDDSMFKRMKEGLALLGIHIAVGNP